MPSDFGESNIQRTRLIVTIALSIFSGAVSANSQPLPQARQILPVTLVPAHYDLTLIPNADALIFKGTVQITGEMPAGGRQIVLNAKGLVFEQVSLDGKKAVSANLNEKLARATLTFPAPFAAGRHTLSILYHGPIGKGTIGFFAMDYDSATGKRRTLATNFEPAEARRLLPCWDEPAMKATFSITVVSPADRLAISNMPVATLTPLGHGLQRVGFAQTPRMSTYLLFLSIGDFERIHRQVDGVDVGIVVKRGDTAKAAYALGEASPLLHYYDTYFGVHFPLPKLDLIAAPGEIFGGSMENWGAIFYSQDELLFDPRASTERERQLVFLVVSHEMAHQWFGDLVTMAWWDNLWLNEGFARWMQTYAADALHPNWETGLQAADIFDSGKRADAQISTHPVLQPVISAEQAAQAFDSITYDKGAAVITMLEAYVGANAFREGVRHYMRAHAFGNTVDSDLWREIQVAAGKPVLNIEHAFTRQAGIPLIRVEPLGPGTTKLVEGRFAEDPASLEGAPKFSWQIPLAVSPLNKRPEMLLLNHSTIVSGSAPLVNAGGTAYARVAYTPSSAAALAERIPQLAAADQINLLNDAWALGQSGYAPASNLMAFLSKLPAEGDPVVWGRAIDLLITIDQAYGEEAGKAIFRREVLKLLAPIASRLGAAALPGESSNTTILRSGVWSAQARFGDTEAVTRAKDIFTDSKGSMADQRTALDIIGQTASPKMFDVLLARARAVRDPQEKARILRAMASAANPMLSTRMIEIALGPDAPAGTAADLLAIAGSQNPDAVWRTLQSYFANGRLAIDQATRWRVIPAVAGASAENARIGDVRRYGERDMPVDARRPIDAAIASIRLNERVKASAIPDIDRWTALQ